MAYFSKPVHVELSDKGGEVIMFEESRKDSLSKLSDAFDVEGIV